MLSFAPNISWLFPELPFAERPWAAHQAGFEAIEFGFPSHADIAALEEARKALGLKIVLFNQDVPVWDRMNRGYLVDPKRRDEFRNQLDAALEIARRLAVSKVMLPSGVELDGITREAQQECMLENLAYAAPLAEQAGVLLTVEVLNPVDNPGYFLTNSREGLEMIRKVDHPWVKLQFDTYHIQRMEGNLTQTLVTNMNWIGHIQFADNPGRHEPGTGEINFSFLTEVIENCGYQGFIGLEYRPQAHGAASLNWVPAEMRSQPSQTQS